MTQALLGVGGLFLLVYVPLAILAWRRPLLARFAWRESTRRRGQFALLVVGLMVGSASITGSLVGSDSALQSVAYVTNQRLGAVDLTVTANGGRAFSLDVAQQLASDQTLAPYVNGVQGGVEQPVSVADVDQRLGTPNVLLVGFDPETQRRFGAYVLTDGRRIYGGELATGDVVLSHALATDLEAKIGDRLRVTAGSGRKRRPARIRDKRALRTRSLREPISRIHDAGHRAAGHRRFWPKRDSSRRARRHSL